MDDQDFFEIVPLVYNPVESTMNQVLLIDNTVKEYQLFVNGCNSSTLAIVYDYHSDMCELKQILSQFTSLDRIAFVFHNKNIVNKKFLNNQYFLDTDLKEIIVPYQVKHVDFLACNTLQYTEWVAYYEQLQPLVTVGASNDETGNIKYGGDWVMENTNEDVKSIYFNELIDSYTSTLANVTTIETTGNVYIKQISQKAIISFFEIGDKYYFASFINSPILKNEIGNNLLSYHKNNNFSVVFTNNFIENITIFSLRSDNNKTDTTEISKLYGGGGHRNASGLVINKITNNFSSNILDNNVSYYELENIEVIIIKEKKYITLKIKNSKNINELLKYLIQKRYSYNEEQEGLYCMRNKKNNQLLQEYYEGSIGIMDDKILFCKNNEIIKLKKIEDI